MGPGRGMPAGRGMGMMPPSMFIGRYRFILKDGNLTFRQWALQP